MKSFMKINYIFKMSDKQKLKDHFGMLYIICQSFGWQMTRIRQYKRAVQINNEMNVFLEEIKILI